MTTIEVVGVTLVVAVLWSLVTLCIGIALSRLVDHVFPILKL